MAGVARDGIELHVCLKRREWYNILIITYLATEKKKKQDEKNDQLYDISVGNNVPGMKYNKC